jgi:hypothetical protein
MPSDHNQRAQQLRLQIGRNRRRMDRRLRAVGDQARRLRSWQTYARRFPGSMLLGAFGVGLTLSAGWGGRRAARWLGLRLVRQAWAGLRGGLWAELRRLWRDARPDKPANS